MPASEILSAIREKRRELEESREIRRASTLPPVDPEPFPLPIGWNWVRLGDLCLQVADGPHFSPKYVAANEGVLFLSGRNIRASGFDLSDVKHVSSKDHESFCSRIRPQRGDVLYTKGGTTGVALVNTLDVPFSVWVHVAVLRIPTNLVSPDYLALALNSPHCYEQSQQYTHGTGNRDLGLTRMVLITLPLPPLDVQRRVVERTRDLTALCDDLGRSLRHRDATAVRLAGSLVASATGPAA